MSDVSYIEIKIYDATTGASKIIKAESLGYKEPTTLMFIESILRLEKEKSRLMKKDFFE
jgi:hypothetical protein